MSLVAAGNTPMKLVWSPQHVRHAPRAFLSRGRLTVSPERPERVERLMEGARSVGVEPMEARRFGRSPVLAVHERRYLAFLETAHVRWRELGDAGPEVVANMHPQRYPGRCPAQIVGEAGWYMADGACPIGEGTFEAALAAADTALTAASLLLGGVREVYALCRPPGHHAFADMAGGFCYLNNTAIAAAHLAERMGRVAILDIDVHHGNGTQAIFYERGEVLTLSIHADPAAYYPFFWGHAGERGRAAGAGANRNWPLPVGSGDEPWLAAIGEALAMLSESDCTALVVALGLDVHEGDPLQGMRVSRAGLHAAGRLIGGRPLPVLLVQEGGYPQPELGANLAAFLEGFLSARPR